jgi:hypothetical protein
MNRRVRSERSGFTASRREVEEFRALFTGVEKCLTTKLNAKDRTPVSTLIADYAKLTKIVTSVTAGFTPTTRGNLDGGTGRGA